LTRFYLSKAIGTKKRVDKTNSTIEDGAVELAKNGQKIEKIRQNMLGYMHFMIFYKIEEKNEKI